MPAEVPHKRYPALNTDSLTATFAFILGGLALLLVLAVSFPAWFTTPRLGSLFSSSIVEIVSKVLTAAALGFSVVALWRRPEKAGGLAGLMLTLLAGLVGSGRIQLNGPAPIPLGLDWFLIDLVVMAVVFIPLESAFALRERPLFRKGFRTDAAHFFVSHLSVQLLTIAAVIPASILFRIADWSVVQSRIAALPLAVQFVIVMLVTDLVQYWLHRAFHAIPFLWRFHAVHHSSEHLDWLAASRLHILEALFVRILILTPVYLLGFAEAAIIAYAVFVSVHAILIHANVRWSFRWAEPWLVVPRFHHWHHGAENEAIDKNFALHFPWLDKLFGTHHMPGARWPGEYGVKGFPELGDYFGHLVYPFRRR